MKEPWRSILVAVLTALLTILGGREAVKFGCIRVPPAPPAPPGVPDDNDDNQQTPDEPPAKNPCDAIVKVIMSNGYCSGTIIGPKPKNGMWTIVSAAHCFSRTGEKVEFVTRAGVTGTATVIAINRKADCAILRTSEIKGSLPYLRISIQNPKIGDAVFHCGYGTHIPGNREDGVVIGDEDVNGQIRYRLSVSHGDSGGGIIASTSGELLSPVCCTTRIAGVGDVWGASPRVIAFHMQ